MKHRMHFGFGFALLTLLAISPAAAQTTSPATPSAAAAPEPSLGDYARKVHKEPTTKAKPKVFDNDNLPTNDKLSVVGEPVAENAGDVAPADSSAKGSAPADSKDAATAKPADDPAKKQAEWRTWQDKLTSQKDTIDLASRELEVLQKEYQLRAAAMYADAGNRLRNSGQWDKEDADFKQKIADKQKALDDAKQKLDDLQEEARRAGVPAAMRE